MYKIGEVSSHYFRWEWVEAQDHQEVLRIWQDKNQVYDCDNCGDSEHYFAVGRDGIFKFYRVIHRWEWENYGTEDGEVVNTFNVEEIEEAEARKHAYGVWAVV